MKKNLFNKLFLVALSIGASCHLLSAQIDCTQSTLIRSADTKIDTFEHRFATKHNPSNNTDQQLELTVYQLDEYPDNSPRPLIVFSHGGAFLEGSRQAMDELCRYFASLGYIAVTHDYRLTNVNYLLLGGVNRFYEAAVLATDDLREAVNFMRGEAGRYNIDTNQIVLGGGSAGAIMALHLAHVDTNDVFFPPFDALFESHAHLLEESKEAYKAVLNLSGAILDTAWLSADEIPVYSMHGDMDDVVPYGEGLALDAIPMFGSSVIHDLLDERGIPNRLITVPGGGHSNIYEEETFAPYLTQYLEETTVSLAELLCDATSSVDNVTMGAERMSVFPNPFYRTINVRRGLPEGVIEIYDVLGKRWGRYLFDDRSESTFEISVSHLPPGTYYLKMSGYDQGRKMVHNRIMIKSQ